MSKIFPHKPGKPRNHYEDAARDLSAVEARLEQARQIDAWFENELHKEHHERMAARAERRGVIAQGKRELRALLDRTPIYKASMLLAPFVQRANSYELATFAAHQLLGANFGGFSESDLTEAGKVLRLDRGYDLGLMTSSEAVLESAASILIAARRAGGIIHAYEVGRVDDEISIGFESAIEHDWTQSLKISREQFRHPNASLEIAAHGARWIFADLSRDRLIPSEEIRRAQALAEPVALGSVLLDCVQA